jgi:hypothetical protein
MAYFHQLWCRSWTDTWELVVESPLRTLFIALCVFVLSAFITWLWKGWSDVKDLFFGTGIVVFSTIVIYAAVFVLHLIIFTPKALVEEAQNAASLSGETLKKAIATSDSLTTDLKTSQDRATQLSDALAMSKNGIDPYQWSGLSDGQITASAKALQPFHITSITVAVSRETDAKPLCRGLALLSDKLGSELNIQDVSSAFGSPPRTHKGIIIYCKESVMGAVWVNLFSSYGAILGTDMPVSKSDTVLIFIGVKEIAPPSSTPDNP